jgi:hypothetical protein
MSRVGFEPTISVFERVKTVQALDSAATVIGNLIVQLLKVEVKLPMHLINRHHAPAALPPRKETRYPFDSTLCTREESLEPIRNQIQIPRPVAYLPFNYIFFS